MVDIWSILNLFLPFLVVLLHTYMDGEVDHHGKAFDVGTDKNKDKTKINNWIGKAGSKNIVSVNEELQQGAIRKANQLMASI